MLCFDGVRVTPQVLSTIPTMHGILGFGGFDSMMISWALFELGYVQDYVDNPWPNSWSDKKGH